MEIRTSREPKQAEIKVLMTELSSIYFTLFQFIKYKRNLKLFVRFVFMVSRPMQVECIFSWTYFLAEITDMSRAGHMLGLNVVLHSLFVFIGEGAL